MTLEQNEQKAWMKRFIIIASIIVIVVTSACVTFAVFSYMISNSNDIVFGKIELGNNTSFAINQELETIVPGDVLTENEFKFMKDADSEPFYVRVKFAFSANETALNSEVGKEYLTKLRKGTQYNFPDYADTACTAVWTEKEGNYIYLVKATNNNEFFPVTENDTFYTVSNKITLPFFTLNQAPEYAQAQEGIDFYINIAVQIVQARNLEDMTYDDIVDLFTQNFPEPSAQEYVLFSPYDQEDEGQVKEDFENA